MAKHNDCSGRCAFNVRAALFGLDLFDRLRKNYQQNLVISPLSLHLALGFAFFGSSGKTREEMSEVLRFSNDKEAVMKLFSCIVCKYRYKENREKFTLANKIYLRNGYKISKIMKKAAKKLRSTIENIDFKDPKKAAQLINNWVHEETNGKIKDILQPDSLSENSTLIIVNALHFKCSWKFKMIDEGTKDFWISESKNIPAQYIGFSYFPHIPYNSFKLLDCTAIELPFDDDDLSIIVILPNRRTGIDELIGKIVNLDLVEFRRSMKQSKVAGFIPKFRIEGSALQIKGYLEDMGMKHVFQKEADFSEAIENSKSMEPIYIETVVHRTFIDVNQFGVEAAAATVIDFVQVAAEKTHHFRATHPFIFAIVTKTNRMWFGGVCRNPKIGK